MSIELAGILSVGAALLAVNLSCTLYPVTWMPNLDRRLATMEGVRLRQGLLESGD